jgi:hypothetical protein
MEDWEEAYEKYWASLPVTQRGVARSEVFKAGWDARVVDVGEVKPDFGQKEEKGGDDAEEHF